MAEDSAGADQRGSRHPYEKPFVRNLDVMDTEGKVFYTVETIAPDIHYYGPS